MEADADILDGELDNYDFWLAGVFSMRITTQSPFKRISGCFVTIGRGAVCVFERVLVNFKDWRGFYVKLERD